MISGDAKSVTPVRQHLCFVAPAHGGMSVQVKSAGLALAVLAYSILAIQDAIIKRLVADIPVPQVLFVRGVLILAYCGAIWRGGVFAGAVASPVKGKLVLRGIIGICAWVCYFNAARQLPFAQLTTLYFAAPAIVAVLAVPLLGERVEWKRWAAIVLGFLGTAAASGIAGFSLSFASGLALLAALLWSCGVILTRFIARQEKSLIQVVYNNLVMLIGTGGYSVWCWHPLSSFQIALLLLVGILGCAGQFALFEAARRAPASVTAPLEHTSLVWAFVLGFAIWGEIPSASVLSGACLILVGSAILFAAELRDKPAAPLDRMVPRPEMAA